jgi:hypothetical protein
MPTTNPYFTVVAVPATLLATIYFGPNVLLTAMDGPALSLSAILNPVGWLPEFFDATQQDYDVDALRLLIAVLMMAAAWPAGNLPGSVLVGFAPIDFDSFRCFDRCTVDGVAPTVLMRRRYTCDAWDYAEQSQNPGDV